MAGRDTAAVLSCVDINEDIQADTAASSRLGKAANVGRIICSNCDVRLPGERAETINLGWGYDFVHEENIGDTVLREQFGFANARNCDAANGATHRKLLVRYCRATVRFGVWPEFGVQLPKVGVNLLYVGLQRVHVHDKGGCVQLFYRCANRLDDWAFHTELLCSLFEMANQIGE